MVCSRALLQLIAVIQTDYKVKGSTPYAMCFSRCQNIDVVRVECSHARTNVALVLYDAVLVLLMIIKKEVVLVSLMFIKRYNLRYKHFGPNYLSESTAYSFCNGTSIICQKL